MDSSDWCTGVVSVVLGYTCVAHMLGPPSCWNAQSRQHVSSMPLCSCSLPCPSFASSLQPQPLRRRQRWVKHNVRQRGTVTVLTFVHFPGVCWVQRRLFSLFAPKLYVTAISEWMTTECSFPIRLSMLKILRTSVQRRLRLPRQMLAKYRQQQL